MSSLSIYKRKLLCAIFYATQRNPERLEAPWYEAWDLSLNEFIRDEEEYSICPQDALRILQRTKTYSRYPDFVMYLTSSSGSSLLDIRPARRPIMLIEVKPWHPKYLDDEKLFLRLNDSRVMGQMVEQAKFIFERGNVDVQANTTIMAILAVGHKWRYARMRAVDTSPYNPRNRPSESPSIGFLTWSDVFELGTPSSDHGLLELGLNL
ncbi:hypothetical protein PILCRDRAFT_829595 [Piloderma croceum F 1598]|uniref:Uncharacterized protein n=1 Tax=Piloderma croceum (strain F 1598) TaxID=765440 RepID=A0A0C3EXM5_PILCF|nr:hypothetical protein PILCRDRAFT_829595 [Piloderma croceum F 1598]